ncbi:signal transduction histidine kinase [Massilia sp. MP_M2]|uniref:PAS domain-containing sensor histidine kinase n=1 Tax=Massilia sp. MP_M2 TaxID=3071713 RepID=UPI00319EAC53
MNNENTPLEDEFSKLDNGWPKSYAWAIDQMPCPAYCCSPTGVLVHVNAAAMRIWGDDCPLVEDMRWDGFDTLRSLDGGVLDKKSSPAALAARGESPCPTELLAVCGDGQPRRIVIHAKPVFHADGAVVGALCCLTDISEQHRLQERERDAAHSREEFLTMLAHELRNPLAPIMSIAGLLQRANTDPVVSKMAGVVQRQTRQLARFIADLLDASRVDCVHALPVEPRICTKHEIVNLSLDAVETLVRSRNQRLIVEVDQPDAELLCDPERVAQALGNVLCNASAFTPDGEEICLRVFIEGNVLRAEVIDCGMGIAAQDLQHIFEPFERRALAPGRAPVGAGLGLTIAKGVCEAHGGSICVRSAGPGKGTTVSLALPVALCAA